MIEITHTYAGNFVVPPPITILRSQGVPPGGPADPFLAAIALHLAQSDTCLEITSPLTLTAEEPAQIALASPQNAHCLPDHPTASVALVPLLPGEPLTLQAPQSGYRLYLSWPGLSSPSRFPQPLNQGSKLATNSNPTPQYIAFDPLEASEPFVALRYLPIQELDANDSLSPGQGRGWRGVEIHCKTTPHISRIGTRLTPQIEDEEMTGGHPSPEAEGKGWGEFLKTLTPLPRSEPSLHGAIQVTPDRQLLVHGPDGPTLGGYPKLGAIIQAELPALAQLRPNQPVDLIPITLDEAQEARQEYRTALENTLAKIDQALWVAGLKP